MDMQAKLSTALSIPQAQVAAAVRLMDEGNTVPFIARYRKEVTGSLDDAQLRDIADKLSSLRALEKRRSEISTAIEAQEAMTPALKAAIDAAETLSALEDLYLPYKKKRSTRASVARQKGLEPLALAILAMEPDALPEALATPYVNEALGVPDVAEALGGASDILAEAIADNAEVRGSLRFIMERSAKLHTEAGKGGSDTYAMYADWTEKLRDLPPHRILAINRGEKEGALKVSIQADTDALTAAIRSRIIGGAPHSACTEFVTAACVDSLKRLLYPSLENELRTKLFAAAAEQAIHVFALNLKPLLMAPPLKGRVVMGFDPAYRTGCKIAVVDATGKVLAVDVVYPTPPQSKTVEAEKKLTELIRRYGVSAVAIGNGTASKESEVFVYELLKKLDAKVDYTVVSEAGASVYSASALGSKEFPQYDVSLRSAVSIARRLQDPLSELVKIDPKAIGVGQYQHDMPQKRLDETLGGVVEDCVNSVGVDLNTASVSLLSYVSGIGPSLASGIVAYREEHGRFESRQALTAVPKLGKKAFEQAAGFLRVPESAEPLDNTGVHPESYAAAKKLIRRCGKDWQTQLTKHCTQETADAVGVGLPTLADMIEELSKPGRDPRESVTALRLNAELKDIKDLKPGMLLDGTVRNVVDFGAFVDIGVHQDGLVHISRMCDHYIRHPSELLSVGDIVQVKVLEVDTAKKRISLSMRDL